MGTDTKTITPNTQSSTILYSNHRKTTEEKLQFLKNFLDPLSSSYLNAELSCKGISKETADDLNTLGFFGTDSDEATRNLLNRQADLNLLELLMFDTTVLIKDKRTGDVQEVNDPRLMKIKADASKFVKETLDNSNFTKKVVEEKNIRIDIHQTLRELEEEDEKD